MLDNPSIVIKDLSVSYTNESQLAIEKVSLEIPSSKLVGILGPNGAGKSTLIKAIVGILKPNEGLINIVDNNYTIAYIPQKENIDWHFPISVMEVALMGTYKTKGYFGRLNQIDKKNATKYLAQVGMDAYKYRKISDLSGGQQQRVFIARALLQEPDIFLLDEPFSGVDMKTQALIIDILQKLASNGKTVIIVHHDLQTVNKYFDWVVMINKQVITSAPTKVAFIEENIQKTYYTFQN
mgnify:CR=1 FL=1